MSTEQQQNPGAGRPGDQMMGRSRDLRRIRSNMFFRLNSETH